MRSYKRAYEVQPQHAAALAQSGGNISRVSALGRMDLITNAWGCLAHCTEKRAGRWLWSGGIANGAGEGIRRLRPTYWFTEIFPAWLTAIVPHYVPPPHTRQRVLVHQGLSNASDCHGALYRAGRQTAPLIQLGQPDVPQLGASPQPVIILAGEEVPLAFD